MRHNNKKATLNRPADQRRAMMRNLLTSLFTEGSIKTTDARGKALAEATDELVTRVRKQKEVYNKVRAVKQILFTDASQKRALAFIDSTKKTSGFTRRAKVGHRAGDNALMVQIELVTE